MKKELKKEVQKQLWRMGKKVRDMAGIPGVNYDLLVDEKIRLCIENGTTECDVIAREKNGKKVYAKTIMGLPIQEWKTPSEIFGPKE